MDFIVSAKNATFSIESRKRIEALEKEIELLKGGKKNT